MAQKDHGQRMAHCVRHRTAGLKLKHVSREREAMLDKFTVGRDLLVVDDESSVADTLAVIFTQHGYQARVAYSAEQALELIRDWAPNLAIVDVCLPGMHGIDFSILLLVSHPQCRVLLVSGRPESADLVAHAASAGHPFEIYAKPTPPDELLMRAAELLRPGTA